MNPNKALWEKGDFTRIANTMRHSGEALVHNLGITTSTAVGVATLPAIAVEAVLVMLLR